MKKTAWLEALNVTEDQLEGWIAAKPKDTSIAYWCLNKKYINESAYINWAKNYYQVPAMDNNYENFNIDPEFWLQIKSVSNWSEQLIPLYLYENTMFVLSSEPLEMNWSFPVQYVLGTPEQLSYFWNKLNSTKQPLAKTSPVTEPVPEPVFHEQESELIAAQPEPAAAEVSIEPTMETAEVHSTNLPSDMPSTNVRKSLKEMSEQPQIDQPSSSDNLFDLNLGPSDEQPKSGFEALETQFNITSDEIKSDSNNSADILEGFDTIDTNSTPESIDGLEGLEGLNLKPENSLNPLVGLNLETEQKPEGLEGLDLNINQTTNTPSEMPPLSTTTNSLRLNKVAESQTKPELKQESELQVATPINISAKIDETTPVTTQAQSNLTSTEVGQLGALSKVNQYFKKSLVFKLTNNQVSVSHQDGSWDLSALKNIELTKTPSLFNFCIISKLPFHGQVSEKDSLKTELFQSLKITNAGEHITLMPLVNNNNIDHFVLALGDKQNLRHLSELEKAVPELLRELG